MLMYEQYSDNPRVRITPSPQRQRIRQLQQTNSTLGTRVDVCFVCDSV